MFIRRGRSDAGPMPAETKSPKTRFWRIAGGLAIALVLSGAGIATVWTQSSPSRGRLCVQCCLTCFPDRGASYGACVAECQRGTGACTAPSNPVCPVAP